MGPVHRGLAAAGRSCLLGWLPSPSGAGPVRHLVAGSRSGGLPRQSPTGALGAADHASAERIRALENSKDIQSLSDLDLFLTDAYVRMAQDLTGIRVNPLDLKT
ncbi:MAG: hypothetical protein AAFV49_08210, partial [Pseudomonadota bacterium]